MARFGFAAGAGFVGVVGAFLRAGDYFETAIAVLSSYGSGGSVVGVGIGIIAIVNIWGEKLVYACTIVKCMHTSATERDLAS